VNIMSRYLFQRHSHYNLKPSEKLVHWSSIATPSDGQVFFEMEINYYDKGNFIIPLCYHSVILERECNTNFSMSQVTMDIPFCVFRVSLYDAFLFTMHFSELQ